MSEDMAISETSGSELSDLRARAEALERQLSDAKQLAEVRLIRAELKTEAVRAGMVDLDGLKLIDTSDITLNSDGEVDGLPELMLRLKRAKPWLFGTNSSSSSSMPPPVLAPRRKLATEMTDAEYRVARETLLRSCDGNLV